MFAICSTARTTNPVPDLSLNLAGLQLANPTLTCSGTCGYAFEYADFMDLSKLGGFVTKSITREERVGNEPARIVEVRAGMLNAIGLANVGLDRFLAEKVPLLRKMPCPVIVNVAGHSFDDYTETCAAMDSLDCIAAVELNVSCPNVKDGLTFGTNPGQLQKLTDMVKRALPHKPLIVKLSPTSKTSPKRPAPPSTAGRTSSPSSTRSPRWPSTSGKRDRGWRTSPAA